MRLCNILDDSNIIFDTPTGHYYTQSSRAQPLDNNLRSRNIKSEFNTDPGTNRELQLNSVDFSTNEINYWESEKSGFNANDIIP